MYIQAALRPDQGTMLALDTTESSLGQENDEKASVSPRFALTLANSKIWFLWLACTGGESHLRQGEGRHGGYR